MIGPLGARLGVLVIVESRLAAPRAALDVVASCLAAGAEAIQLRDKGRSARERAALGAELRKLTKRHQALLFVNDRADLALAIEADGVHLGPNDLPVSVVRGMTPPGFLIGRSADEPEVARRAVADGADYIGCGTVFPTTTKADAGDVIGLAGLREVVAAVSVPVVGIGGITVERAPLVAETGAAGVAVIGALMTAADPGAVTAALKTPFSGGTSAP